MGGSRILDWGGPRIEKARDDGQKVALYPLKSWPIGGGPWPCAPPLEPPLGLSSQKIGKVIRSASESKKLVNTFPSHNSRWEYLNVRLSEL